MAAAALKQTRMTVLLSLNAVAILLAGVLIAGAMLLNGGMNFRVVDERTDEIADVVEEPTLIDAETNSTYDMTDAERAYVTSVRTTTGVVSEPVPDGELWGEQSIFIYQTAN